MAKFLSINPRSIIENTEDGPAQVAQVAQVRAVETKLSQLSQLSQPSIVKTEKPAPGSEWDAEDWAAYFCERAGIVEFDGGLSRSEAEARAYECCVSEWLIQHPPPSNNANRCAHCNETLAENEALPFLGGAGAHVWMHGQCHKAWYSALKDEARSALAAMSITGIEVKEP